MNPPCCLLAKFRHGLNVAVGIFLFLSLISRAPCAVDAKTPAPPEVAPFYQPHDFFTIDLDPRYRIIGTGAMTEEAATGANCYHFTYNANGKLMKIEYRRAGIPMPDPLLGVACIDFEYQPGIEYRWYHDAQGHPVNDVYGVAGEELSLNPAGYPTDILNLDASGSHTRDSGGVIHYVRTLDNQNRVIACRRIGLLGTDITDTNGFFETRTVYDQQGRPIERGNYDASGSLLNNDDGVALVRTTYTIYPDSTQTIASYFDASGVAVEEKSSGVHELQRTIDKRGFTVDESYFDATGAPTLANDTGIHERRYQYDDRGNELSEEFFGTDGKPKNEKMPDAARIVYKYDDKNRVIEKAYFGDDGAPQVLLNLGAAVIRQEYDDQGNLVRRQFFDGQGHPSPHVQYGAPAIRIKVEGDTTIITLRNANDKPMKNPIEGYYAFSYKTDTDHPLSLTNKYFDRHGREMSLLRVRVINPHLHALKTTPLMQISARYGAGAAGLGGLLGCFIALRKSSHTKRRKVYVPTPLERFLGWLAVFAILEGSLRFFMTVYWAWVGYQYGHMGPGVYVLETIFIVYFFYRFLRFSVTMRVLNIGRDDIHRLVRDFFAQAGLKPEWNEAKKSYITPAFGIRVRWFGGKYHAYIAFLHQQYYSPIAAVFFLVLVLWIVCFGLAGLLYVVPLAVVAALIYVRLTRPDLAQYHEGHDMARGLNQYIRTHVGEIQAPVRTRALALYYPSVAFCYFLFAGVAFYTLWQLIKGY